MQMNNRQMYKSGEMTTFEYNVHSNFILSIHFDSSKTGSRRVETSFFILLRALNWYKMST